MSNIKIYENTEFGKILVLQEDNKELFEATASALILGYSNPYKAIGDHCKRDGVTKREVIDSLGRKQMKNFITEGNLYRLITHSKLPNAEKVEKWIFEEVLPSIRKNGGYIANQENLSNEELLAKAVLVAQNTIAEKNRMLEEQKPKVLFAEGVTSNKGCILVDEMAKILKQSGYDTGEKRLFRELRERGFLNSRKGYADYNLPSQKSMDMGLFYIKKSIITKPDGSELVSRTPMITGKGQVYFFNLFMREVNNINVR